MTAPLSLTSTMKLAKQASKGTPATAGFMCGRFVRSEQQAIYEYIEAQGEHHCGVNLRPTLRKSLSRAGGYTVPLGAQGFLYPDVLGLVLLGLGFGLNSAAVTVNETQTIVIADATGGTFTLSYSGQVTNPALPWNVTADGIAAALKALSNIGDNDVAVTGLGTALIPFTVTFQGALAGTNAALLVADDALLTGEVGDTPTVTVATGNDGGAATTAKLHTGTIASRADAKWLTSLHSFGEGADLFTLRATDVRLEQLVIEASTRGVMATFAGLGIKEDAALGTETGVAENEAMLLPSKGACTINIGGDAFTSSVRGLRFLISNPTDKNEQNLFALERSDLPSTGIECGFSATGLDVSYDVYRQLKWNGLAGVGPGVQAAFGDITFNFQAAELIGAGLDAVPYQFGVTIPRCEFRMGQFRAQGRELVRFDLAGLMVDDVNSFAHPITVSLTNGTASY